MGLFNKLFRRNKNNIEKDTNEINSNLTFKYKSGTMCEVEFSTMRELKFGNGNRKMVQEAIITYTEPDGSFTQKRIILDPQVIKDEQGNSFYATEAYYKKLAKENIGLVKGFFQKDQLNTLENNYIGYIGVDPMTGVYNRSYDKDLKNHYDEILRERKNRNQAVKEQMLQQELKGQIERIENIKPHYKTSHAQVLTKEDYDKYHGDR